jgi:phage virion morphogenesis protein
MIHPVIEIDNRAVLDALHHASALLGDTTPLMRPIAGIMADAVESNFEGEHAPDGTPWPTLKPATINARKAKGYWPGRILQQRGELAASIAREFGRDYALVGTNKAYAAIHQFGGDIQIAARSQPLYFRQGKDGSVGRKFVRKSQSNFAQWAERGAHAIHMPARPFLGLDEGHQAEILALAKRAIENALRAP